MATLEHLSSGEQDTLRSSHSVGRSDECALRTDNAQASLMHAVFHWSGMGWELRDLASSNGTFVDQRPLEPGQTVRIEAGMLIAFGDPRDLYRVMDIAPPRAYARASDGTVIQSMDGVLALPSADDHVFLLYEDEPGNWLLEHPDGTSRRVEDGEMLTGPDDSWRLHLPRILEPTDAPERTMSVDDIGLRLEVSADETNIKVTVIHRSGVRTLDPRADSHLLLELARLRLEASPDEPDAEQGWIEREALLDELTLDPDHPLSATWLSTEVHRVRGRFRALGVVDAVRVIDRRSQRPPTLRLGIRDVEIVPLGAGP